MVLSIGILNFHSVPASADECASASASEFERTRARATERRDIDMRDTDMMESCDGVQEHTHKGRPADGADGGQRHAHAPKSDAPARSHASHLNDGGGVCAAPWATELHVLRYSLRQGEQGGTLSRTGTPTAMGARRPRNQPAARALDARDPICLSDFDIYKSPTWYSFRGEGCKEECWGGSTGAADMVVAGIHPVTGERMISRFKRVGDADMTLFAWDDNHHDEKFGVP